MHSECLREHVNVVYTKQNLVRSGGNVCSLVDIYLFIRIRYKTKYVPVPTTSTIYIDMIPYIGN